MSAENGTSGVCVCDAFYGFGRESDCEVSEEVASFVASNWILRVMMALMTLFSVALMIESTALLKRLQRQGELEWAMKKTSQGPLLVVSMVNFLCAGATFLGYWVTSMKIDRGMYFETKLKSVTFGGWFVCSVVMTMSVPLAWFDVAIASKTMRKTNEKRMRVWRRTVRIFALIISWSTFGSVVVGMGLIANLIMMVVLMLVGTTYVVGARKLSRVMLIYESSVGSKRMCSDGSRKSSVAKIKESANRMVRCAWQVSVCAGVYVVAALVFTVHQHPNKENGHSVIKTASLTVNGVALNVLCGCVCRYVRTLLKKRLATKTASTMLSSFAGRSNVQSTEMGSSSSAFKTCSSSSKQSEPSSA